MLLYLAMAWPYLRWQLQVLELAAHTLEAVIIIFGMLQMGGRGEAYMTWVMIGECRIWHASSAVRLRNWM